MSCDAAENMGCRSSGHHDFLGRSADFWCAGVEESDESDASLIQVADKGS